MKKPKTKEPANSSDANETAKPETPNERPSTSTKEIGGRGGLDPVRYGDWEKGGKCVDF